MVTKYSIFTWISDSLNVDFLQGQFLVGCVALGTWNSWRCTCTCREKGRSVKSLQEQIELFETEMYVCGGFFSLEKSPWYSVVCFSQHFHHISGFQTKFNCLTRSRWMPVSRQFEPRCFLKQETLPLLLSTGWFQERIRASFTYATLLVS